MSTDQGPVPADDPGSVAAVYEDGGIAASYLQERMRFSWQRLLHRSQVRALNQAIAVHRPATVLEVAPGPARLSVELHGITRGVIVENSAEMIGIARNRLAQAKLGDVWTVLRGDAFDLQQLVPSERFELAYTFRFIRHFRDDDRTRLYEQLRQKLAPSGLLMLDVVNETHARQRKPSGIAIHDACYSASGFVQEMKSNGFEVLSLTPILRHFRIHAFLSYKLDDIWPSVIEPLIGHLERIPSSDPLEWIALCRKR